MTSRNLQRSLLASAAAFVLGLFSTSAAHAQTTYTWNLNAAGTWDTVTSNWLQGGVSATWTNGIGNSAVFGNVITANRTIAISGSITTGNITFEKTGTFAYSVGTALNDITLNSGGASDTINVNSGTVGGSVYNSASSTASNTITGSNINFTNNLVVNNDGAFGTSTLRLASAINRTVAGGSVTVNGQGNTFIDGAIGATVTGGFVKNGTGSVTLASATNAFTGGVTINGGVLAINANDAMLGDASNGVTINGGGTFRYNNSVTTPATRTFTVNGTASSPSVIDMASGVTTTFNGVLAGGGSSALKLTLTGGTTAGTFSVESANAGYTGAISVGSNGSELIGHVLAQRIFSTGTSTTLRLQNAGTLSGASSITVQNGAGLTITQPTTAVTGRLGTVPLTLNSARFVYNPSANGGVQINDTFGTVGLTGYSIFSGSTTTGPAGGTTLNFGNITRIDNAMVMFRAPQSGSGFIGGPLSSTAQQYFFANLTPDTTSSGTTRSIIPWAGNGTSTSTTDPQNFMTYDANGFRPLNTTTEVVLLAAANTLSSAATGTNVRTTSSGATQTILAGGQTINSFSSSTTQTITAASSTDTLTITSGALATFNTITISNGTINLPNGGYFHLGFPFAFTSTSSLTGANGISVGSLGASSSYALRFTNTVANPFTGGLFIQGNASVNFTANNQLGNDGGGNAAGNILLGGGQLLFVPTSAVSVSLNDTSFNRAISVNAANGTIGTGFAGAVLQIPGTISGSGQVQYGGGTSSSATGVVELSNSSANTYSGGTLVSTGILRISNANQLGTGAVLLNGGTLQAAGTLSFANAPTLVANSTIDTQANTINLNGGINGSGGTLGTSAGTLVLTKNGTGILNVAGSGTLAGSITLPANSGTVRLSGAGSLTNLSAVTINSGSSLVLDNSGSYVANRLSDRVGINLNSGLVNYIAPSSATTDPAEQLGTLTLNGTNGVVNIDASAATSPTVLRFSNYVVTSGNVTFRGTDLGGTVGNYTRILFNTAPVVSSGDLLPNAFFANTSGTTTSSTPAAYDFTRGVLAFTPPIVNGTVIDNFPTTNTPLLAAFTTTGNTTANTGVQIYSLTLDGGSTLTLANVNAAGATNNNTAIGTLRIAGGVLTSQNGAKTITDASGGPNIVDFTSSIGTITTTSDLTFNSTIALNGTGGASKVGAGVLNLNGPVNMTGGLFATVGTMNLGATATFGAGVNIGASGTGTTNINALVTVPVVTVGTGGTVNNNGAPTVTTTNLNGGIFNINTATTLTTYNNSGGTLNVNENTTTTPSTTTNAGTINIATGKTLTIPASSTLNNIVAGNGSLNYTPASAGLLTLTGNNTFSGGVTGNGNARFLITNPNALGTGTLDVSLQSASSSFSTPTLGFNFGTGVTGTVPNNIILTGNAVDVFFAQNNSGATPQGMRLTGVISGGSALTNLVIEESGSSQANVVILDNPNNTFQATIKPQFGGVAITSDGALGNASNGLNLNSSSTIVGALRFDANNITVASTRTISVTNTASINTNGNDATIAGPITGTSALTKIGAGTLVLTATNTNTANLTVSAGTLLINGSYAGSASNPTLTVAAGATLGGTGSIGDLGTNRNLIVNGTLSPGNSPGLFTVNGTVALNANSNFRVELQSPGVSPGTDYDQLVITGSSLTIDPTATLTGVRLGGYTANFGDTFVIVNNTFGTVNGTFAGLPDGSLFSFNGQVFQIRYNVPNSFFIGNPSFDPTHFSITWNGDDGYGVGGLDNGGSIVIAAVPEPATIALMVASGLGSVGYVGYRRWRSKKNRFARNK